MSFQVGIGSLGWTVFFQLGLYPSANYASRVYLFARHKVFQFSRIYFRFNLLPLRKLTKFHLISICGNFIETFNYRRVSGESPETLQKLCNSINFPHQEIR